jgi:hypothetical protein
VKGKRKAPKNATLLPKKMTRKKYPAFYGIRHLNGFFRSLKTRLPSRTTATAVDRFGASWSAKCFAFPKQLARPPEITRNEAACLTCQESMVKTFPDSAHPFQS